MKIFMLEERKERKYCSDNKEWIPINFELTKAEIRNTYKNYKRNNPYSILKIVEYERIEKNLEQNK